MDFKGLDPFGGYSAELIANWCLLDLRTAKDYKAGRKKPSRRVLRLFELHSQGKVLAGPMWRDYTVREDGKLYGPALKYGFNGHQLAWLSLHIELGNRYIKEREKRFGRKVSDLVLREHRRLDQAAFPPEPTPKRRRRPSLD